MCACGAYNAALVSLQLGAGSPTPASRSNLLLSSPDRRANFSAASRHPPAGGLGEPPAVATVRRSSRAADTVSHRQQWAPQSPPSPPPRSRTRSHSRRRSRRRPRGGRRVRGHALVRPVAGFCTGYAVKKAGRAGAFVGGLGFMALTAAERSGYIAVRWDRSSATAWRRSTSTPTAGSTTPTWAGPRLCAVHGG